MKDFLSETEKLLANCKIQIEDLDKDEIEYLKKNILFFIEDFFREKCDFPDLKYAKHKRITNVLHSKSLQESTDGACINFPICSDTGSCADGTSPCWDNVSCLPGNDTPYCVDISCVFGSSNCTDTNLCFNSGTVQQKCKDEAGCANNQTTSNCFDWIYCLDNTCNNNGGLCQDFRNCIDGTTGSGGQSCTNGTCVNQSRSCADANCTNNKCMRLGRSNTYTDVSSSGCYDSHCDP